MKQLLARDTPKRWIFHSSIAFEDWDYRNSVEKGIGGSETSAVEMAWRLAQKGCEVICYAPIPKDCPSEWRGTKWIHVDKVDFSLTGNWMIYRRPDLINNFSSKKDRKNQKIYLMCQDWDYDEMKNKKIQEFDKIITLSKAHGRYLLKKYPLLKNILWLTSNGIKGDLIEEIEREDIQRNPFRIIHASSPDRGLKNAILIFRKAKEYIPELELHAFYGFNNLSKLTKQNPKSNLARTEKELKQLIKNTKGVTFHGRVSQNDLYREYFKSGIYIYITDFFETSNIASQEAQAMGAVPVFSPVYAQGENIQHGIGIEGATTDPLTIVRAAAEVVRLAMRSELQEKIRLEMMPWARKRFDWDNFVQQWIYEAEGKRKEFEKKYEFPEQL